MVNLKKYPAVLIIFLISCSFCFLPSCTRDETERTIFFTANEDPGINNFWICSINDDGSDFKKIAGPFLDIVDCFPVVSSSPDGSRLVYNAPCAGNPLNMCVWTMNTDGTGKKQMEQPSGRFAFWPTYSIEGDILYIDSPSSSLGHIGRIIRISGNTYSEVVSGVSNEYLFSYLNGILLYNDNADCIAYNTKTQQIIWTLPAFFSATFISNNKYYYCYTNDISVYDLTTGISSSVFNVVTPNEISVHPGEDMIVFTKGPGYSLYSYRIGDVSEKIIFDPAGYKMTNARHPSYVCKPR
jgi:hypothetical protein